MVTGYIQELFKALDEQLVDPLRHIHSPEPQTGDVMPPTLASKGDPYESLDALEKKLEEKRRGTHAGTKPHFIEKATPASQSSSRGRRGRGRPRKSRSVSAQGTAAAATSTELVSPLPSRSTRSTSAVSVTPRRGRSAARRGSQTPRRGRSAGRQRRRGAKEPGASIIE